jgi:hypothetical protein
MHMSTRTRLSLAEIAALAILAPATAASGRSVEAGGGRDVSAPAVPASRLGAWQHQVGSTFSSRLGVQRAQFGPLGSGMPGARFGFGSGLLGSAPVGKGPSTLAVDAATHTIYVANGFNLNGPSANGNTVYVTNNGDSTVSVFNGAICNAQVTSGCGQTPATVPVGSRAPGIFADDANHTVYVGNFNDGTVSMINSATCNATDLASCPTSVPPRSP